MIYGNALAIGNGKKKDREAEGFTVLEMEDW